jgi:hypothetical protein
LERVRERGIVYDVAKQDKLAIADFTEAVAVKPGEPWASTSKENAKTQAQQKITQATKQPLRSYSQAGAGVCSVNFAILHVTERDCLA